MTLYGFIHVHVHTKCINLSLGLIGFNLLVHVVERNEENINIINIQV